MRRGWAVAFLVLALLAVPGPAGAQEGPVSGLLVRVEGDVVIQPAESADLVLVVGGDAEVRGRAGAVVVLGGTARLIGARVGHVAVFRGTVELRGPTVVEGDVWLTLADLDQGPGAVVEGSVRRGVARFGWGWLAASPGLSAGLALLLVGVGLLAVAWAPRRMIRAGEALTASLPGAAAWALVIFGAGPALGALAFFTVLGLPASLVALGVLLPLAGLAGFSVSALRLGRLLLRSPSERPYGAACLGSVLLLGLGLIPVAGQILVFLAAALGAGALVQSRHADGAVEKLGGPEEGPGGDAGAAAEKGESPGTAAGAVRPEPGGGAG